MDELIAFASDCLPIIQLATQCGILAFIISNIITRWKEMRRKDDCKNCEFNYERQRNKPDK